MQAFKAWLFTGCLKWHAAQLHVIERCCGAQPQLFEYLALAALELAFLQPGHGSLCGLESECTFGVHLASMIFSS